MLASTGLVGPSFGGDVIENGRFEDGKSRWAGNGQIVYLNEIGEEVDEAAEGKPAMAVRLNRAGFTEIRQRIRTDRDPKQLSVEAVISTSADFAVDQGSRRFSGELNWKVPGTYYWSAWVNPRADVVLAVKTRMNLFRLDKLGAGEKSKVVSAKWDVGAGETAGDFQIIFGPGEGTAYVHSVEAQDL